METLHVDKKFTPRLNSHSVLVGQEVSLKGINLGGQQGAASDAMVSRTHGDGAQLHHSIIKRHSGIEQGSVLVNRTLEKQGKARGEVDMAELRKEPAQTRGHGWGSSTVRQSRGIG